MASVSRGITFGASETVTAAKLHTLVDNATVSAIVNADCAAGMALVDTKLAQITTAAQVHGTSITGVASLPAGAGVIPAANLTSVAQKGANSDITSLAGLTTALTSVQGGTGSTLVSWVVFDGTASDPITPDAHLNVDGNITKNATGDYTINWDTNYGSANYCIIATAKCIAGSSQSLAGVDAKATGSADISVTNPADANGSDVSHVFVFAIGSR